MTKRIASNATPVALTDEQRAVVAHPLDHHGSVVAPPGAGKTSTIAALIADVVLRRSVPPTGVLALVFNRRAAVDLRSKLTIIPKGRRPEARTFHSIGEAIIRAAEAAQLLPMVCWWKSDELVRRAARGAIAAAEQAGLIARFSVGIDEAIAAIGFWKARIVRPEHAAHDAKPELVQVYAEHERLRTEQGAITFDDVVPAAAALLARHDRLREQFVTPLRLLVLDEAQDLNRARIELACQLVTADVALVTIGDIDQAINEWCGAEAGFLAGEHRLFFRQRPWLAYHLTQTHRFGPRLALPASLLIAHNRDDGRGVFASKTAPRTTVTVHTGADPLAVNKALVDEIVAAVTAGRKPSDVAVLVRCGAQATGIGLEMRHRRIPFRVDGLEPLLGHVVVRTVVALARAALKVEAPARESAADVAACINAPNRRVKRAPLIDHLNGHEGTLADALTALARDATSPLSYARGEIAEFLALLRRLHDSALAVGCGAFFAELADVSGIRRHLDDYFGHGDSAVERHAILDAFVAHAGGHDDDVRTFINTRLSADTKQGADDKDCILVTSIHRTKGLGFAIVVMPDVVEGLHPCAKQEVVGPYDRREAAPMPADTIEAERRVFYTGITRAQEALHIGAPCVTGSIVPSRFLDEAGFDIARIVLDGGDDHDTLLSDEVDPVLLRRALDYVGLDLGDEARERLETRLNVGRGLASARRRGLPPAPNRRLLPPGWEGAL